MSESGETLHCSTCGRDHAILPPSPGETYGRVFCATAPIDTVCAIDLRYLYFNGRRVSSGRAAYDVYIRAHNREAGVKLKDLASEGK